MGRRSVVLSIVAFFTFLALSEPRHIHAARPLQQAEAVDINLQKEARARVHIRKLSEFAERVQPGIKAKLIGQLGPIQRELDLDPKQVRKLEVAAGGAAKKMMEPIHDEFEKLLAMEIVSDREAKKADKLVSRSAALLNSPDGDPFWNKTLLATFTPEQRSAFDLNAQKRERFRHQLWLYETLDKSLTSQKRAALKVQTPSDFARFRGQLWIHRVVNEMGRLRYQERDAVITALTSWLETNEVPSKLPNPRTRRWLDVMPESATKAAQSARQRVNR